MFTGADAIAVRRPRAGRSAAAEEDRPACSSGSYRLCRETRRSLATFRTLWRFGAPAGSASAVSRSHATPADGSLDGDRPTVQSEALKPPK